MALETGTTIYDLDAANPLGADSRRKGDDHLRLIKDMLLKTFLRGNTAAKPSAGTVDRYYFDIEAFKIYYDNGTTWDEFAAAAVAVVSGPLGQVSRPEFSRASTTTLTLSAGTYMHVGTTTQLLSWDSLLTFTPGSGGSNSASVNLGANQVHYLYVDDSAVVTLGATTLTVAELLNNTTAPSWSETKHGLYNGEDRCIFSFRTNGSSQIVDFYHSGELVTWADHIQDLASTDIDTWTAVTLSIPAFSTMAITSLQVESGGAGRMSWRTTGTSGSGHLGSHDGDNSGNPFIAITDSSQRIDVTIDSSGTEKLEVETSGWYFPTGM
jgi:hypothetical protein